MEHSYTNQLKEESIKQILKLSDLKDYIRIISIITFSITILIFIVLFFVTRPAFFNSFIFDEKTGFIGDTIGGVGNVIVGIVSIILIFLSFIIQYQANKIQIDMLNEEKKSNQMKSQLEQYTLSMKEIKDRFFSLKVIIQVEKGNLDKLELIGIEAINYYLDNPNHIAYKSFVVKITYLLDSISNLIIFIKNSKINDENSSFLLTEVIRLYNYYLKNACKKIIQSDLNNEESDYLTLLYMKIEEVVNNASGNDI